MYLESFALPSEKLKIFFNNQQKNLPNGIYIAAETNKRRMNRQKEAAMKSFLKNNFHSAMPQWLAEYDGTIDIAAVQNTRCVYYPGAGFDGQPIHTFNGGNAAHLYIYVR